MRAAIAVLFALAIVAIVVAMCDPALDATAATIGIAVGMLPGIHVWLRPQSRLVYGWIAWAPLIAIVFFTLNPHVGHTFGGTPIHGAFILIIAMLEFGIIWVAGIASNLATGRNMPSARLR